MPITSTGYELPIAHDQVSVGTTATLIAAARNSRGYLILVNHGTTAVYVGGSSVTTSNGCLLAGVVGQSLPIKTNAAIYAIVASGTQTISFIEEYE